MLGFIMLFAPEKLLFALRQICPGVSFRFIADVNFFDLLYRIFVRNIDRPGVFNNKTRTKQPDITALTDRITETLDYRLLIGINHNKAA